jgi:hypothetical protein
MEALWFKNHENPKDRKSYTWAPLRFFYLLKTSFFCDKCPTLYMMLGIDITSNAGSGQQHLAPAGHLHPAEGAGPRGAGGGQGAGNDG